MYIRALPSPLSHCATVRAAARVHTARLLEARPASCTPQRLAGLHKRVVGLLREAVCTASARFPVGLKVWSAIVGPQGW